MLRNKVLESYRNLLKAGKRFPDYNFSQYVIRSTQSKFRRYRNLSDITSIEAYLAEANKSLQVVQRQTVIRSMFAQGEQIMQQVVGAERKRP
jgi:LYR motif-containing protein 4